MGETVVHFVRQNGKPHQKLMDLAFEEAMASEGNCAWIEEEECLEIKTRKRKSVFIFAKFEGPAFTNIAETHNRIYGPNAILACFQLGEHLPRLPHPVNNMSMKGVTVSCTSLEKDARELVHQRIAWMCGEVSKDFHDKVTHLIAGEVGSKKYLVAGSMNKKIMTVEWVKKVWEDSQIKYCKGDSSTYMQYRCPIFMGCVITVSRLDTNERAEIREVIESGGGQYSGQLKIHESTHLILHEPEGQKYVHAVTWKIPVITPSWVYESIEAGYCLDSSKYRIAAPKHASTKNVTSTPTTENNRLSVTGPDLSCISVQTVDETAMNNTLTRTFDSRPPDPLDDFKFSDVKASMFLDGCKIYLSGFTGARQEKIRKLINLGGGTRLSHINETVSHVVMGERVEADVAILESGQFRPYVVGVTWVLECARQGTQVQEEDFLALELTYQEATTEIGRPQRETTQATPSSANTSRNDTVKRVSTSTPVNPGEMMDLLSQYLPDQGDQTDESALLRAVESAENDQRVPQGAALQEDDDATQDPSEDTTMMEKIFTGKTFVILGLPKEAEDELASLILESDGMVLERKSRTVPDFAVVPLVGCEVTITAAEIVTLVYIRMCLDEGCLLPVSENELYSPVVMQLSAKPLEDCVLSISGYDGVEREALMYLAEELGAMCQEYFVKLAKKNLLPSTHLVVNAPAGSKYAAAKKWNLPAVSKKWLFDCARTGKRQSESHYLIDRVEDPNDTTVDEGPAPPMPSPPANVSSRVESIPITSAATVTPAAPAIPVHERVPIAPVTPAAVTVTPVTPAVRVTPVRVTPAPPVTRAAPVAPREKSKTVFDMETPVTNHSTPVRGVLAPETTSPVVKRTPCLDKTNVSADGETANMGASKKRLESIKLANQRVQELVQQSKQETPKHPVSESTGVETPGKFLDPNKKYLPKFDTDDLMAALKTPVGQSSKSMKDNGTPLGDMFSKYLAMAVKNTTNKTKIPGTPCPASDTLEKTLFPKVLPLNGVVIGVSKKLIAQQSDFNNTAADLGADYRWTYDQSCTHFIFEGRQNDINKEFRQAREHGKHIVSPFWLQVCKEQNAHVDESLFPHTYNPNLALSVTSTKGTPSRLSRRSTRSQYKQEEEATASPVRTTRARVKSTVIEDKTVKIQSLKQKSSGEEAEDEEEEIDFPKKRKKDDNTKNSSDEEMVNAVQNLEDHGKIPKGVKGACTQPMNTLAREALVDDIKILMAATKTDVKGKRRNRRTDSLSTDVTLEEPEGKRPSLSLQSEKSDEGDLSGRSSKERSKSTRNSRSRSLRQEETQSQMPEVTWDDPETRAQQEILAAELAKNSESQSPVRDASSSDEAPGKNMEQDDPAEDRTVDTTTDEEKERNQKHTGKSEDSRIPTPEPPSLAMPTAAMKTDNSILQEPVKEVEIQRKRVQTKKVFLFSGLKPEERIDYGALLEQLGGQMVDASQYEPSSTHLIVEAPSRNEKFLSFVAAGKWVLHKSYLEACRQANAFVKETDHEWGSPATADILTGKKAAACLKLAQAAYRWRRQLNEGEGAFSGWKCLVLTDSRKEGGFRRLLEAGGAVVLREMPDTSFLESNVNYAFIDLAKCKGNVDLNQLVSAGVHCVKPDFIATYLTEDPLPTPKTYYISELKAKASSSSSQSSRKRKPTNDSEMSDSKRSRLQ